MQRNIKYLYAALAIATVIMGASAYWLIRGAVEESVRLEKSSRDSLISTSAQSNTELFKFIDTLTRFSERDPAATKTELITRFDVLWSRLETNTSGPLGRNFALLDGVTEKMEGIKHLLRDTEQKVLTLDFEDKATINELKTRYRDIMPIMHEISLKAADAASKSATALHDELQDAGYWAKILLPSLLLTGFTVSIILWSERQSLNNLARSLEVRVEDRTLELQKSNEALKAEVHERKQLEEKLVQSQKMEMIGQLTGGIAHDFNNLLAIIQGNAELLEAKVSEEYEKHILPIIRATERGSDLTQRLLAFSRQQPLRPTAIDLHKLVSDMIQLLDRALGETIQAKITADADLWNALVDKGQVENALLNLAINAEHAMPDGGDLTISLKNFELEPEYARVNPDAEAGEYVLISVADTGTGIPKSVLPHVIEPFFTTKEVGKGSGLGLSMVYGFIKQSGGFMDIYSEEGIGTTICLYLPRSMAEEAVEVTAAIDMNSIQGSGETVFLLEDNLEVLKLTRHMLTSLNYKVLEADSIPKAEEILKQAPHIDIVLSDVLLPGGQSGPEFMNAPQSQVKDRAMVFMSGFPGIKEQQGSHIQDHQILLRKPFQRQELAQALRQSLNNVS